MKLFPIAVSLGLLLGGLAVPAYADVKGGVDAWDRGDYPAAISQWRPLAISGDSDAQFNLAQAYKLGRGVPTDLRIAQDWYAKAAAQGHARAEDNLGLVMFQNGDRQKALPYIQRSSTRGDPRAQYVLGTALFNGDMIGKDWVRAYALMTRASASGLSPASASLAQMDKYIPLDQRQKGLAFARELETQTSHPVLADSVTDRYPQRKASAAIKQVELPAYQAGADDGQFAKPVKAKAAPPKPEKLAVRAPLPVAVTPVRAAPIKSIATTTANASSWRVQLGAFGDQANARALWSGLEHKVGALAGLQPYLVKAGTVVRLQAGPLSSKTAAERVCGTVKASGGGCMIIAP